MRPQPASPNHDNRLTANLIAAALLALHLALGLGQMAATSPTFY